MFKSWRIDPPRNRGSMQVENCGFRHRRSYARCVRAPCGWSFDRGCGALPFSEELRRAAEAAHITELPNVAKQLYAAFGAGAVTEAEVEAIDGLIRARQDAPSDPRDRSRRGDAVGIGRCRSIFPPKRVQRSPDRSASIARRRELAASGPMPPALARCYTTGELAVLRIVADEWRDGGVCELAVDTIAARAGVSRRKAQGAIRLAESDGLLLIQERARPGDRHLPNAIRILSREWQAWIAHGRRERVQKNAPHGYQRSNSAKTSPTEPLKGLPRISGRPRCERTPRIRGAAGDG